MMAEDRIYQNPSTAELHVGGGWQVVSFTILVIDDQYFIFIVLIMTPGLFFSLFIFKLFRLIVVKLPLKFISSNQKKKPNGDF